MAADLGVVVAELLTGRDAEHLAHQVEAGDLLGDAVLDLQAGVDLEEGDRPVLGDEELAGAGADVAGLGQDRLGGLVEPGPPAPRSGTVPAPPRPASGCGAAASSRGWRRPRRCRAGRPGTGSRRGAAGRGTSPRSTRRGRRHPRPRAPRTRRRRRPRTSSRATLRPRPPPPKAALIAIGRPCSSAKSTASSASLERVLGAGGQRGADLLGDVAGPDLVARGSRWPPAAGRSRPARRRSRPGRSRRSRRGSRSPGAPSRRRTSRRRR